MTNVHGDLGVHVFVKSCVGVFFWMKSLATNPGANYACREVTGTGSWPCTRVGQEPCSRGIGIANLWLVDCK